MNTHTHTMFLHLLDRISTICTHLNVMYVLRNDEKMRIQPHDSHIKTHTSKSDTYTTPTYVRTPCCRSSKLLPCRERETLVVDSDTSSRVERNAQPSHRPMHTTMAKPLVSVCSLHGPDNFGLLPGSTPLCRSLFSCLSVSLHLVLTISTCLFSSLH